MFLILRGTYATGYAVDNTPFVVRDNIADAIKALEKIGEDLLNSLLKNGIRLNTDKCRVLLNSKESNTLKIEDICQKASQKLNALARLTPYMGTTKKLILMYAFFKSQFNYCPLVWSARIDL